MKELKKIPLDKGFFEAGGVKFFIKNTLTVERFKQFERLQNHFGFGKSFSDIYADLKFAMELANKGKMVESWNVIVNLRDGIKNNIFTRFSPSLQVVLRSVLPSLVIFPAYIKRGVRPYTSTFLFRLLGQNVSYLISFT